MRAHRRLLMLPSRRAARLAALAGLGVLLLAVPYGAYAAVTWYRYGGASSSSSSDPLLDTFIPIPEVEELHEIRVSAPAELTLDVARTLDLQSASVNRTIFAVRNLPARMRGRDVAYRPSPGLMEEMLSLGWGVLEDDPGRAVVMGAVTQPWQAEVVFRALPPDRFASFADPGYAKIVWTLEVEALGPSETLFRTRTRVATTDPASRARFRRYWAVFSPGIILIRYEANRMVRNEAERRARQRIRVPVPSSKAAMRPSAAPAGLA